MQRQSVERWALQEQIAVRSTPTVFTIFLGVGFQTGDTTWEHCGALPLYAPQGP